MSEKALRNIFIFGTIFFFIVLGFMTYDSLSQVTSTRTPALTDAVIEGKKTWQKKNCNDCHTILGIGGYFAPELTKVADRTDPDFLKRFLKDPKAAKPGTTMPGQNLTDTEVANLVAFFDWVAGIDTNDWPPQPMLAAPPATQPAAPGAPSGATLFQQKGCSSCHQVNGMGTGINLSNVASRPNITAEYLEKWLKDPKSVKPDATMPKVPLTDEERQAMVLYLLSLK